MKLINKTILGLASVLVMNGCAHHGYAAPIVAGAVVGATAVALTTPHYGYGYPVAYRAYRPYYYNTGYPYRYRGSTVPPAYVGRPVHRGGHKGTPRRY